MDIDLQLYRERWERLAKRVSWLQSKSVCLTVSVTVVLTDIFKSNGWYCLYKCRSGGSTPIEA